MPSEVLAPASATVGDLTERDLIARIRGHLPPAPPWLLVGIGDDAAVVEPERNRADVFSVDALVEGVHFDRAFVPPEAIGHRALAVNLSDLAAMGATPRLALLSLVLPPALPLTDFDAMIGGFTALAARHRVHVGGGNLARSPGPLMLDVTVVGSVKPRQALTRSGARPGDDVYVSGTIGAAAAGLCRLREITNQSPTASHQSPATRNRPPATTPEADDRRLETAFLRPEPRVRLGLLVGRNRAATACMDLSDGLADGAHQLAQASGVGMTIDADALPIDPCARAFFEAHGLDPVIEALTGGDDYELLVTARPRGRRRLAAAEQPSDIRFTRIGTCSDDGAVVMRRTVEGVVRHSPVPAGFSHFR
jgi:thiamine-monophosphate kinase